MKGDNKSANCTALKRTFGSPTEIKALNYCVNLAHLKVDNWDSGPLQLTLPRCDPRLATLPRFRI